MKRKVKGREEEGNMDADAQAIYEELREVAKLKPR